MTGWVSGGEFHSSFTVRPGEITTVEIPSTFETSDEGLHVVTEMPVSLYASNFANATYDATGVLPTEALGNDYIVQSYPSTTTGMFFAVVITEDNTRLHLHYPDEPTETTWYRSFDAGEVFRINGNNITGEWTPLNGLRITSEECKPFAVFSGCEPTYVPNGYPYADHIYEEMIPTHCWGRHFVITTSLLRTHDIVRVTAKEDSTVINWEGDTVMMQARESYEIDIRSDNVAAVFLEIDKAVSVILYLTSATYGGGEGDPSMCVIHPIEQQIQVATFATFNTSRTASHYVNLTISSDIVGEIALDGRTINNLVFNTVPGHPEYSYAKLNVSNGSHTLSTNRGGFNAHVYGLGDCESYSYAVGASIDPVNPQAWMNDILYTAINDTNKLFCLGDTIRFKARVVNEDITHVRWDFDDGSTAEGMTIDKVFDTVGEYSVRVTFSVDDTCWSFEDQTLILPVVIMKSNECTIDTAVCGSQCEWRDSIYTTTGRHSQRAYPSSESCVPIITLNILDFIAPPEAEIVKEFDCEEQFVKLTATGTGDQWTWSSIPDDVALRGHEHDLTINASFATAREYQLDMVLTTPLRQCVSSTSTVKPDIHPFKAVAVADASIVTLDASKVGVHDNSKGSEGREWYLNGFPFSDERDFVVSYPVEMDSATLVLDAHDIYGCHDTDTLILRIKKEALWVPNIFTPEAVDNNRFKAEGLNVKDFELWIYTREGLLVWHSTNLHEGWDGTKKGEKMPTGAYIYTLRYTTLFDPQSVITRTRSVTLVR